MNSRRSFVKIALTAVGAAAILPQFVNAQEKRRAKPGAAAAGGGDLGLPMVEPGKGMAASVNYQTDHNAVKDAALKIDRGGLKFADQKCSGCMLYSKVGMKDGNEVGKCTLFAGSLVQGKAWCSSFAKKA